MNLPQPLRRRGVRACGSLLSFSQVRSPSLWEGRGGCWLLLVTLLLSPHIIAWVITPLSLWRGVGGEAFGGVFLPLFITASLCTTKRATLSDVLVLTTHGLQEIVFLHRINLNLGRCVCPLLTLHFLHIYCCYLDLRCLHVGTHGSCVRSNDMSTRPFAPYWADARAVRPYNVLRFA